MPYLNNPDKYPLIQKLAVTADDVLPVNAATTIQLGDGSQISISRRLSEALERHAIETHQPLAHVRDQLAAEIRQLLRIFPPPQSD